MWLFISADYFFEHGRNRYLSTAVAG